MFYSLFLFRPQKMRQPFSGTAERIFMKLIPNDRGGMQFETSCRRLAKVVPPPGEWRMLICVIYAMTLLLDTVNQSELRYDSGRITRGRHARRLRYTTMSGRMDVIQFCVCCQCVSRLETSCRPLVLWQLKLLAAFYERTASSLSSTDSRLLSPEFFVSLQGRIETVLNQWVKSTRSV